MSRNLIGKTFHNFAIIKVPIILLLILSIQFEIDKKKYEMAYYSFYFDSERLTI